MNTDPQDQAIDWRPGWTKGLTAQAALLPPGVAPQAPSDPLTVELDMDGDGRIIGASLVRADGQRSPVQIVGDLAAAQQKLADALPSGLGVSSAGWIVRPLRMVVMPLNGRAPRRAARRAHRRAAKKRRA